MRPIAYSVRVPAVFYGQGPVIYVVFITPVDAPPHSTCFISELSMLHHTTARAENRWPRPLTAIAYRKGEFDRTERGYQLS